MQIFFDNLVYALPWSCTSSTTWLTEYNSDDKLYHSICRVTYKCSDGQNRIVNLDLGVAGAAGSVCYV